MLRGGPTPGTLLEQTLAVEKHLHGFLTATPRPRRKGGENSRSGGGPVTSLLANRGSSSERDAWADQREQDARHEGTRREGYYPIRPAICTHPIGGQLVIERRGLGWGAVVPRPAEP